MKAYKNVDHVMVDINCQLKVVFKNGQSSFFDNISDLKNFVVKKTLSKCYDFLEQRVLVLIFESLCFYLLASDD